MLDLTPVQRLVEDQFLDDLLTVTGPDGKPVLDDETGEMVPNPGEHLWDGPGAVAAVGSGSALALFAEQQVPDLTSAPYLALVPLDAAGSRPFGVNDVLTVSGTRLPGGPRDPQITGRRFRISQNPPVNTWAVVRVVALEEV